MTEKEDNIFNYYIIKYYNENEEYKVKSSRNSFEIDEIFSGFIHLLNDDGKIVFAKKINNGIEDEKKFFNYEFKKERKNNENLFSKVEEECFDVTTVSYTDNYVRWGNGPAIYVSSTYNGTTVQTVCDSYWLPDLNISGGGGSGSYTNNGNGGVYNSCVGVECKYVIDDMELETIVVSPDIPVTDVQNYLKCFDTTQSAQLTVYVDQPKANQNDSWTGGSDKAGHAFINLSSINKMIID